MPVAWVRAIMKLPFPASIDDRLQKLMDGNTEGQLTPEEYSELEELVDLNEQISLARGRARIVLNEAKRRQG